MKTIACSNAKIVGLLSLLLIVSGNLIAAEKEDNNKSPIGCHDMGYQFDLKTLNLLSHSVAAKQSLYFLYNTTNENLSLYQMRGDESSRSIFLNHIIGPNQWAVLSTSEKKLKYICAVPQGNSPYGEIVDCSQSIRVCEYDHVKFGLNNQGNYWLVNSDSKNAAVNVVVHYGIIPGV